MLKKTLKSAKRYKKRNSKHLLPLLGITLLIIVILTIYFFLYPPQFSYNIVYHHDVASPSYSPPTPSPTFIPLQPITIAYSANCPTNTYFANTSSVSFCYPTDWKIYINENNGSDSFVGPYYDATQPTVELQNGDDIIRIIETGEIELPAGGPSPIPSRKLIIDGNNAVEQRSNSVYIFRDNSDGKFKTPYGYIIHYLTTQDRSPQVIDTPSLNMLHMLESTLHINSW